MKTANQRYKEYKLSGGELSFKEWIQGIEENEKNFLNLDGMGYVPITDTLKTEIDQLHKQAGEKTGLEHKYILGIDQRYVFIGGVILVLLGGILIYKNIKK